LIKGADKMTEHTALPLTLEKHHSSYDLVGGDGIFIMALTGFRYPSTRQREMFETTAHLIVTACNSHADLIGALKLLLSHPSDDAFDAIDTDDGYTLTPLQIAERNAGKLIRKVKEAHK